MSPDVPPPSPAARAQDGRGVHGKVSPAGGKMWRIALALSWATTALLREKHPDIGDEVPLMRDLVKQGEERSIVDFVGLSLAMGRSAPRQC